MCISGVLTMTDRTSKAPHITFGRPLCRHQQCGMAICAFHLGFSLVPLLVSKFEYHLVQVVLEGLVLGVFFVQFGAVLQAGYYLVSERRIVLESGSNDGPAAITNCIGLGRISVGGHFAT